MTITSSTASQTQQPCASQGHAVLGLARTMLDTIVQCHAAVLQDDDETMTVIHHELRRALTAGSVIKDAGQSVASIQHDVIALLAFAARTHETPFADQSLSANTPPLRSTTNAAPHEAEHAADDSFANWFFALSQTLGAVHPQAAELLRLRLQGLDSRTLTDRLELPPRLVRRLFQLMAEADVFDSISAGAAA